MKVLIIADPVAKLKPAGDSTLVMARELLSRGHDVFWGIDDGVEFSNQVFSWAGKVANCPPEKTAVLQEMSCEAIRDFDAVMIRKDPPFDASYVRLCWLLSLGEAKVWMFNRASLLLRYHEKLVPLEALAQGFLNADDVISTYIGSVAGGKNFVKNQKIPRVISKPFLGFGGGGILLADAHEFQTIEELRGSEEQIVQPFHEEVSQLGDRRVFFLAGEILAQFTRMPKTGGFVSNLAQGGTAVSSPLSPSQVEVLKRLGKFLKAAKIDFAGADLIGDLISEVNVTSPTGLVNLLKLEGKNYAVPIIDFVEKTASSFRAGKS